MILGLARPTLERLEERQVLTALDVWADSFLVAEPPADEWVIEYLPPTVDEWIDPLPPDDVLVAEEVAAEEDFEAPPPWPDEFDVETPQAKRPGVASPAKAEDAVVTARLAVSAAGRPPAFQVARLQAGPPLSVNVTLGAFGPSGGEMRPHVLTLPDGAGSADVAVDASAEVLTLRVDGGPYRVARAGAVLFPTGDAGSCSDAALVEAYRQGPSEEAFAALVARHHAAVLRTCQRVLGDWHEAEDVSQLVFVTLGQRALRLQASLAGWLTTVARNASIAMLRARSRRSKHERAAAKPVEAPAAAPDEREWLDAALEQLPGPLADAVRLRYLDGWSQREAAELAGCPRGTLSQRAAAGLQRLREVLGKD